MSGRVDAARYPWRGVSVRGYTTLPTPIKALGARRRTRRIRRTPNEGEELHEDLALSASSSSPSREAAEQAEGVPEEDWDRSDWTAAAETVHMQSETSRDMAQSRQCLEALGELLASKASATWAGTRRYQRRHARHTGEAEGTLEASARYVWERRLFDGRMISDYNTGSEVRLVIYRSGTARDL